MKTHTMKLALATTMMFAIATNANGKEVRVTGIFSDMHFVKEAGDVTGMEVFIVYTVDGYYAVVQFAEGTPVVPVVVPIKVNKASIQFTVPLPNGSNGQFVGTVTDDALIGRLENGGEGFKLRRRNSYWQQAR